MLTSITFLLIAIFGLTTQLAKCSGNEVDWRSVASSRGDRFPDFSYSGYRNSEIPLPTVNHYNITLPPPLRFSDDMTPSIQEAIDNIAYHGGGVIRLPSGRISITAGIQLRNNVIVTGSGESSTTLVLKRPPSKPVFTLGRLGIAPKADFGFRSKITNTYVPIGTSTVTVVDGTGFQVGQNVFISRAVTESWVRYNGMSDLVKDDEPQEWIPVGKQIMAPNVIKAIHGNDITLGIPLSDNLNRKYMQAEIRAYTPPEPTSEMGIKNLRIEVPRTCSGTPLQTVTCNYAAVRFASWTADSWVSGLTLVGFNNFIEVQRNARRITLKDIAMDRNQDIQGAALPSDILLRGSQILIQNAAQIGLETARSFAVSTDSLTPGPNTVTGFTTTSNRQTIEPHERWSWGLLVEDVTVPTNFSNRGTMGTGHGWTINGGVGWNIRSEVNFQSPPLGINWCVGCGKLDHPRGNATFIKSTQWVSPHSLFIAQLVARGVSW